MSTSNLRADHALARFPPAGLRARKFWSTLLLFLPLVLVVGFRGDTGDTSNYVDAFDSVDRFPADPVRFYAQNSMEWGFGIASWLVKAAGFDVRVLLLLFSFATFYFLARAAERTGTSLLDVAPFYLGNYFLVQQMLQIRQGLAIPFAFSILPLLIGRSKHQQALRGLGAGIGMIMIHLVSVIPLGMGLALDQCLPRPGRRNMILWSASVAIVTFIMARAIMSIDVITSLGRLADYASDSQYNGERGLFEPANIRAVLILVVFWLATPVELAYSRIYVVLLGLYACHVGIRFGFYDFTILSGRLSTTLGFDEVLLLPLLLKHAVADRRLRVAIALAYMIVHAAATLALQTPTLVDDYFTPLQYHHSAD